MADGIELGKAYVQIVPSAQGIKSALTEMFDEETDEVVAAIETGALGAGHHRQHFQRPERRSRQCRRQRGPDGR